MANNTISWKSPYSSTPTKGRYMLYYEHNRISPHVDDRTYKVVAQWVHRPDLMALDLYGDSDLWFVFGIRNALRDPCYDLVEGREIVVPTIEHVLRTIGG